MTARTTLLLILLSAPAVRGDDWPQWMGPKRDNIWREDGLLEKFPAGGPKVVWTAPIAGGYAGPAVAGGRIFVTDYVTDQNVKVDNFVGKEYSGTERVLCLDAASGKEIWKHEYPVKYSISYPAGPRCTPTVHDGKVYALGAVGNLFCFAADSGKIVWSKDLKTEYMTKPALWGYAAHPLIDGKKLLTLAGGDNSHIVALDKDTGGEIWRSQTSREQGYSPPTIIEAGGVRQLVLLRPNAVTAIDPETGKRLWSVPYEASNGSIIMSPIKAGDYLFVAGYSDKNMLLKLAKDKPAAEVVWQDKKGHAFSPVNVQPMLDDGTLYGFDQSGMLYGVELPSGRRLWESADVVGGTPAGSDTAFLVKNGSRYWMFTEKGELVIGKLSPKGYEEIDRAKVIEPTNLAFRRPVVWCAPAFANKRMYVRNDNKLVCIDLAK